VTGNLRVRTYGAQQTCPPAVGSAPSHTGAFVTTSDASTFELGRPARARRFPLQIGMAEFTNPTGEKTWPPAGRNAGRSWGGPGGR